MPNNQNSSFAKLLLATLFGACIVTRGPSQTSVLFPLAQMTGITNDTTITVRPVNNPVEFHNQIYWLPPAGIQLRTANGSATTNLIPNDYNVTIAGVPGSWRISVQDTNITLNAAEIGDLTTYIFTNRIPGVLQLLAGPNITLAPANGKGIVTISASGSGGGGGGSATNAYQIQAGNKLITIATNTTDFIYTISGVSQTNGYPWGVLYDATGTARAATNGYPWSVLYDSAGTATAATNGWPWGALYDVAGAARSATNGYPWGPLYDPTGTAVSVTNGYPWSALYDTAGSATAATNGWPWGSLYDSAGAAHAATNGYPWGVLYDATGAARSATNGYPWGVLYDAAGSAVAVTNGYPWGSLYDAAGAAHSATNGYPWGPLYDTTGSARSATNGYPWGVLYDNAGSAVAVTNGYPWGTLYDAAGTARSATNGYPWGTLYDAIGSATAATNGLSLASGLAAFRNTNTFASTNPATALSLGIVKVDNSTIVVGSDGTISATTGGGGSVTSVGLSVPSEFSVTGSPVTGSGTLAITRTGDANFLGLGATNIGFLKVTNTASIGGQALLSALVLTNGFTNQALLASTLIKSDANKKVTSISNWIGAFTNDGSGNFGGAPLLDASALKTSQYVKTDASTNLVSSLDGYGWTNLNVFDSPTNLFSGTTFLLGTNSFISTSSAVRFVSVTNVPPIGIERWGQLTIVASGSDIVVTNPVAGWRTSDMVSSRTVTNGNTAVIAMDVQAGMFTNFVILQFK